jgi:hypothetical protein
MVWSKMKQQLESFLCPELVGRVEYRATSYRYLPDKAGQCYITVDKKEVFKINNVATMIRWYQTEQEIKNDLTQITVNEEEIEKVRKDTDGRIPEERLAVIAKSHKISEYAKEILNAQSALSKADFYLTANKFLSDSIEDNLNSKDILLNVFALVDRRIGKKRLFSMEANIRLKHPIVQYFYELRRSTM